MVPQAKEENNSGGNDNKNGRKKSGNSNENGRKKGGNSNGNKKTWKKGDNNNKNNWKKKGGDNKKSWKKGDNNNKNGRRGNNNNNNNNNNKGGNNKHQYIVTKPSRPKHHRLDIKFDPEIRKTYLTTLSDKKQERRAFGLAMQKVKDRKAKIEARKEEKEAMLTQIEEAEMMKKRVLYDDYDSHDDEDEDENDDNGTSTGNGNGKSTDKDNKKKGTDTDSTTAGDNDKGSSAAGDNGNDKDKDSNENSGVKVETFQDDSTTSQFGGQVIVTTSYGLPSSDDEDEDANANEGEHNDKNAKKRIDESQKYAGSVKKYLAKLKGKMPAKNAKFANGTNTRGGKRGNHGAAKMIGGSATDLKLAQKTLNRVQSNNKRRGGAGAEESGRGGKKKGKKRR